MQGLRKPSAGFPETISASLTREIMPDVRGQDALVPLITPSVPPEIGEVKALCMAADARR
jgi:hypothetical protein